MAEASRTIEINVAREKMFEVITDYNAYPEFLQGVGCRKVTIDKTEGNAKVVTQQVEIMGKKVTYTLKMVADRPHRVSWSLVKGEMMSKNNGSWSLEELGPDKTRATYTLELKLGLLIPSAITTALAATSLPAMLEAFKKRAEGRIV
jgi:ribosome-associated toxin RatA of RatAB toxin-antitoxin module